jgi:hypothetical protein
LSACVDHERTKKTVSCRRRFESIRMSSELARRYGHKKRG